MWKVKEVLVPPSFTDTEVTVSKTINSQQQQNRLFNIVGSFQNTNLDFQLRVRIYCFPFYDIILKVLEGLINKIISWRHHLELWETVMDIFNIFLNNENN